MKIIARPAGQGKTTELIRMAAEAEQNTYIVVLTHQRAYYVHQLAKSLGLHIPFPLTYDEIRNYRSASGVEALCLDDIEQAIQRLVSEWAPNRRVLAATLTHAPVMGYICAVCGAPAECDLVDLDTGATLICDECGGKTVVVLLSAEAYTNQQ